MKLAKKIIAVLLAVVLVGALFAGCSAKDDSNKAKSDLTVGFIFLHDENSTYDKNFITAAEEACEKAGVKILKKTNIPEGNECYNAAADLVDEGCDIVFADSLVMKTISFRLLRSSLKFSSFMQPAQRLIQKALTTIIMLLHQSMKAVSLQALLQVKSSMK